MKLDKETYKDYNTVYKYKKSILLDQFISFVPFFALIFIIANLQSNGKTIPQYIMYIAGLTVFIYYFLSDFFFKGASIGKRIYKIKINSLFDNTTLYLVSLIKRRFMEVYINKYTSKLNFLEKSKYIDKNTGTRIIDDK